MTEIGYDEGREAMDKPFEETLCGLYCAACCCHNIFIQEAIDENGLALFIKINGGIFFGPDQIEKYLGLKQQVRDYFKQEDFSWESYYQWLSDNNLSGIYFCKLPTQNGQYELEGLLVGGCKGVNDDGSCNYSQNPPKFCDLFSAGSLDCFSIWVKGCAHPNVRSELIEQRITGTRLENSKAHPLSK